MPTFTGDKEWRVEDVPAESERDLDAIWVRAWRGGEPVEAGPSWRFATPQQEADARSQAAAIAQRRNAAEAAARKDA